MNINQFLDSTYLKTPEQAAISEDETLSKVDELISEAIENQFKAVMIRPKYVHQAKAHILENNSEVLVGTVISFHEGTDPLKTKIAEAEKAIADGADELDVVLNYEAFLKKEYSLIEEEVELLSRLALDHDKTIKWIIEVAALNDEQITKVCSMIRRIILTHFGEAYTKQVFVKSSTGFYNTPDGLPNGATFKTIKLMLEAAKPLPVKAAGGIKSYNDAVKMINLGVLRIGTSSAKQIETGNQTQNTY